MDSTLLLCSIEQLNYLRKKKRVFFNKILNSNFDCFSRQIIIRDEVSNFVVNCYVVL